MNKAVRLQVCTTSLKIKLWEETRKNSLEAPGTNPDPFLPQQDCTKQCKIFCEE